MAREAYHGTDGEWRKSDAHAQLEARRGPYLLRARRSLLGVLLARGAATIDDVCAAVELPPDIDPKLFGAVPGPLARAGIIHNAGFAKTTRAASHSRILNCWVLADRGAALR